MLHQLIAICLELLNRDGQRKVVQGQELHLELVQF